MNPVARKRKSNPFFALLSPAWLTLGIFFLLPLALMLLISFRQRDALGQLEPIVDLWQYLRSGQFIENYRQSLDPLYLKIFWRSLWMAMLTTALCLAISYPVAYYITILARPRMKNLLLIGAVIPFWTSFLIRTYAWILILRTQGFINSLLMGLGIINSPLDLLYNNFSVMVGLVYGELPFMILPLYASLEKLDRSLLEASADLGAGRLATLRRVTIPMTMPGIIAGIVLVFIPAIGQFIVPDLLGGAKSILIGNLIQNQFTAARNKPFGSAIAFELTAGVLILLFLYAFYAKRKDGEAML